jgi:amino acid adenylation domain-containing protein
MHTVPSRAEHAQPVDLSGNGRHRIRVQTEKRISRQVDHFAHAHAIPAPIIFLGGLATFLLRLSMENGGIVTLAGATVSFTKETSLFDLLVQLNSSQPDTATSTVISVTQLDWYFGVNEEALKVARQENRSINLEVKRTGSCYELEVHYHLKISEEAGFHLIEKHFVHYLSQAINRARQPVQHYPLLSPREQSRLLDLGNHTDCRFPNIQLVHEVFSRQARKSPDAVALAYGDVTMSYKAVDEQSTRLALVLQEMGVAPEVLVAVCFERSFEMVITLLAILKAGGAYLPLDPNAPGARIAYILKDSEVTLCIRQSNASLPLSQLESDQVRLHDFDELMARSSKQSNLIRHAKPANLAYVIYTSGSTGKPKGIEIAHRSIMNTLYFLQHQYPVRAEDAYLLKTHYTFDVSLSELFGWFFGGGRLVILPPQLEKQPDLLFKFIQTQSITHLNFAPSALRVFLLSVRNQAVSNEHLALKYLMVAGEAFPPEVVRLAQNAFPDVQVENIYGPTEVSIYGSYFSCNQSSADSIASTTPIGKPISNTRMYVLDLHQEALPLGVVGELCIAGPGLARGYRNRPALTEEKFVRNPFSRWFRQQDKKLYRTGDLGRWRADGSIEYLGRIDTQVKIRGFRIELGEIEKVLETHQSVKSAIVLDKQLESSTQLVAYYESHTGQASVAHDDLVNFLQKSLPDYMIPAAFWQVEKIPHLSSGKVDRISLRALNLSPRRPGPEQVILGGQLNPADVSTLILNAWRRHLRLGDISLDDNFFRIGGDSLSAYEVMDTINRQLQSPITLTALFENVSIRKLTQYVLDASDTSPAHPPVSDAPVSAPKSVLTQDVAIVGMSGSFPDAANLEEFWKIIAEGRDCISEVPKERWNSGQIFGSPDTGFGKTKITWGGFLKGVDEFDPLFFDISPREASVMDPQQRLLLTHTWWALEHAGIRPGSFSARKTGVFIAAGQSDYQHIIALSGEDSAYAKTATLASMIPNRISTVFDLHGPSEAIEATCASSLVALHRALHSLRNGECEQAIVGAVHLLLSPDAFSTYEAMGLLSGERTARPFESCGQGYIRSEGVGAMVLMPLETAIANRCTIHAVIKGTGVAHGGRGISLTAPNPRGMKSAISQAYAEASIDPRTVSYIEAHGIAAPVADAIEMSALKESLSDIVAGTAGHTSASSIQEKVRISSLKTTIGHGEVVSGLAAIFKVVLALQHRVLPGLPRYTPENINPKIIDTPFEFSPHNRVWNPLSDADGKALPRRGAVNGYGFGVNAHAIIEEYPAPIKPPRTSHKLPIVISTRTPEQLRLLAAGLATFLTEHPSSAIEDIAYTLWFGREPMKHRLALVAENASDIVVHLKAYLSNGSSVSDHVVCGTAQPGSPATPASMRDAIALWTQGREVDLGAYLSSSAGQRISLAAYPFSTDRYWYALRNTVNPTSTNAVHTTKRQKRICVIGAGPAGLVAAKSLLEEGHLPTIFESEDVLGGVWNMKQQKEAGAYQKTRFQNSKDTSFFSDFYPDVDDAFLSLAQVNTYLKQYADRFKLTPVIHYQSRVKSVEKQGSMWKVVIETKQGLDKALLVQTDYFDGVCMCQGRYRVPKIPTIPGLDQFRGEIIHAGAYFDSKRLAGKRVLVVGNGVSGMDIAEEASQVARKVYWSMRSLRLVLPRMVGFLPNDYVSPANLLMPDEIRSRRNLENLSLSMPDYYALYQSTGLFPSLEEFRKYPFILINDGVLSCVASGKITPIFDEIVSLDENSCRFSKAENSLDEMDTIIFCTGYAYEDNYPFLKGIDPVRDFSMGLFYQQDPTLVNLYGLLDIGTVGSFPFFEMVARWYARIQSGTYQLSPEELGYRNHPHHIVVAPIASILFGLKLGLLPKPEEEFKEFWKIFNSPAFSMVYRLRGDHADPHAQKRLDECQRRSLIHDDRHDPELQKLKYRILAGLGAATLQSLFARKEITPEEFLGAQAAFNNPLRLDWSLQFMTMGKMDEMGKMDQRAEVDQPHNENRGLDVYQSLYLKVRNGEVDSRALIATLTEMELLK